MSCSALARGKPGCWAHLPRVGRTCRAAHCPSLLVCGGCLLLSLLHSFKNETRVVQSSGNTDSAAGSVHEIPRTFLLLNNGKIKTPRMGSWDSPVQLGWPVAWQWGCVARGSGPRGAETTVLEKWENTENRENFHSWLGDPTSILPSAQKQRTEVWPNITIR